MAVTFSLCNRRLPLFRGNNINGVDDGYRGTSPETAVASVTMTAPNGITTLQDAYVQRRLMF